MIDMPSDFRIIYRILKALSDAMDVEEPNLEPLSAESLGITEQRRQKLLELLADDGYIKGVTLTSYYDGTSHMDLRNISITLKGLEYLHENPLMKQAANIANGVAEIIH